MSLPQPPTNYALANVEGQVIDLSWTNGSGATEVVHEFSTNGTDYEVRDNTYGSDSTLNCSMTEPDTHYWMRAKSRNASGDSAYSNVIEFTTGHYEV